MLLVYVKSAYEQEFPTKPTHVSRHGNDPMEAALDGCRLYNNLSHGSVKIHDHNGTLHVKICTEAGVSKPKFFRVTQQITYIISPWSGDSFVNEEAFSTEAREA